MQWRRQRKITHVIGSSNHVLLLTRYQDAPPGEEDEEDGIRNGYVKGQENGTSSKNGQGGDGGGGKGHKTGRTDSVGSTTSDYASDYASAASRSRRSDTSGFSSSQPKFIFNENEYARITTPRQDILFKKGYLSRKKMWPSTASMSATPSTIESQSASHSTADGSETTEDQQLLDCKENGGEEYAGVAENGEQVAYGTFYDQTSGYYYEYPLMVVGPGMPGEPVMHDVLTAVPCGPVPLRPIQWVNPAFMPKMHSEQCNVVDYQTAQFSQYPTLVDENGVPLTAQTEYADGCEELCEAGNASWNGSAEDEQQSSNDAETQNGTTETSTSSNTAETPHVPQPPTSSEQFMENELAHQLHMTHVAVPPMPEAYIYPGHYMFGPSLINVNGVTIQSGPMVRETAISGRPMSKAWGKWKKKKKPSRRQWRRETATVNGEEEEEFSSEADNAARLGQAAAETEASEELAAGASTQGRETPVAKCSSRPLNPECQEFRPSRESVTVLNEAKSNVESATNDQTRASSNGETTDSNEERIVLTSEESSSHVAESEDKKELKNSRTNERLSSASSPSLSSHVDGIERTGKLVSRQCEEVEARPVDFAAEVFANVSIMAERALTSRSVVEGTPMETEIGLDATSVNFQTIVDNLASRCSEEPKDETVPNGREDQRKSGADRTSSGDSNEAPGSGIVLDKPQRESGTVEKNATRSASPGMINRTTTPINVNTQRLPDSYESLVTRGANVVSCSLPSLGTSAQTRPRKYAKATKFVREATPGPDLEESTTEGDAKTRSEPEDSRTSHSERDAIVTGVEALECELHSLSTTVGTGLSVDVSNDDSGVETQSRFSTDRPITNAVTEWLQRANSPELFVVHSMISESEAEDDELEEPPKNLQGNPMPALSANSNVNDGGSSRGSGKFASFIDEKVSSETKRTTIESAPREEKRRKRRGKRSKKVIEASTEGMEKSSDSMINDARLNRDIEARLRDGELEEANGNCELTKKDSVAGMRVAKSSRTRSVLGSSSQVLEESTRRSARRRKAKKVTVMSSRGVIPIENVEIKLRRTAGDERDEGIVEDEEIGVRTFEKGEIVVTNEGKVLPVENYEPIILKEQTEDNDRPRFRKITCEKSTQDAKRCESSDSENPSKRNSLGSIEEPDVLECWEIETVEPVTPKKIQGKSLEGEGPEDDRPTLDPAGMEIVNKYYRLEATRDSGASVTSLDSENNNREPETLDRMTESLTSEEIPVIGEKMNKIVEAMLERSGIPIEEAVEAYESYYAGKLPPYLVAFDARDKYRPRATFGQDTDREGPVPCKGVCCNIQ